MFEAVILWLTTHIELLGGLVVALAALIENSKRIKSRPITSILRFIGRGINSEIIEDMGKLKKTVTELDEKLTKSIVNDDEKNAITQKNLESYHTQLEELKKVMDDNEKDRLKSIVYDYGRIARSGGEISIEEYRHIQNVYT